MCQKLTANICGHTLLRQRLPWPLFVRLGPWQVLLNANNFEAKNFELQHQHKVVLVLPIEMTASVLGVCTAALGSGKKCSLKNNAVASTVVTTLASNGIVLA